MDDASMMTALRVVVEMRGGMAAAENEKVKSEWPACMGTEGAPVFENLLAPGC